MTLLHTPPPPPTPSRPPSLYKNDLYGIASRLRVPRSSGEPPALSLYICTHIYIYIYMYIIYLYIYIYISYIFHIYFIYISYIFHIYFIYISYIFHIYFIYISYIDLFISVCWSGTLDIWRHKNWHSEAVSSAWKRWRETWISAWVLVSLGIIEYQIGNDYNDSSLIIYLPDHEWLIDIVELDDGTILTGTPINFDGKNPWVSG